jgi:hypothetical protein
MILAKVGLSKLTCSRLSTQQQHAERRKIYERQTDHPEKVDKNAIIPSMTALGFRPRVVTSFFRWMTSGKAPTNAELVTGPKGVRRTNIGRLKEAALSQEFTRSIQIATCQ